MPVKGSFDSLKKFGQQIKRLPKETAIKVAELAAPEITKLGHETFAESTDAYGKPWKPGADGRRVTLHDTGKLESRLRYEARGTKLRVNLGVRYAKYQIGKRPVFPKRGLLPDHYVRVLERIAVDVMRGEIEAAS